MGSTIIYTRIKLRGDTKSNLEASDPTPLKNEMIVESDTGKFKFGDGINSYTVLKYANLTPDEIETLIENLSHDHANKEVLDGITANLVSEWNTGYTHSQSSHAPSTAQENVIEHISVNGNVVTPSEKTVDIVISTVTSDLTNDSNFVTSEGITKVMVLSEDEYNAISTPDSTTLYVIEV